MNRRILLIDADPGFHQTLTRHLARYAFDIVVEPEPEQAVALASADLPALLIVGVEEPEKSGFKVFQKCKKAPLSKVPIMLITASVPPESFAKHKALKTHADEYLDKRDLDPAVLLEKIDALVTLGEPIVDGPSDDDLDIPVEVDEIPLADGDMVLEEEVGDDGDFGAAPKRPLESTHSQPAGQNRIDSVVDADIEDAFGGLLGDDVPSEVAPVEVAPEEVPPEDGPEERDEISVVSGIPEAVGFVEPSAPTPSPSVTAAEEEAAVPGEIHDGGLSAPQEFDSEYQGAAPEHLSSTELPVIVDPVEPALQPINTLPPESLPAIALDPDDLLVEDGPIEMEAEAPVEDEMQVEVEAPTPEPAPVPQPPVLPRGKPTTESPPVRERRPTGRVDVVELGLDALAEDADREQSGVYDRRSIRTIGELERQVQQLKSELDRARAEPAKPAGESRQGEFLKLRENLLNQGKELTKAKDELAQRQRELTEVQDKLVQATQDKASLEAKASELMQKAASESTRAQQLETREKTLAAQLATAQQELAARTQAADAAEQARAQLDRDLANERAMRASSASEAERALRVEREQMIARHQGEIATIRAEIAASQEAALGTLRSELEMQHAAAIAAAVDVARGAVAAEADQAVQQLEARHAGDVERMRDQHASALDAMQADHAAAVEKLVDEHESELGKLRAEAAKQADVGAAAAAKADEARALSEARAKVALADAQKAHEAALEQLRGEHERAAAQHQLALERATNAHAAELAKLREAADDAQRATQNEIERLKADHQSELARAESEAGGAIAATAASHDRALAELRSEIEALKGAATQAASEHDRALAAAAADKANALTAQANEHAAQLAARDAAHAQAREQDGAEHAQNLADLRAEIERQSAAHGIKLDVAKRELDEMLAKEKAQRDELAGEHAKAAEALAQQHAEELAKVAADKQRAIDDIQKASAEHRAVVEKNAAAHRDELAKQKEAADREVAELNQALHAAKKLLDDEIARHQAERAASDEAHQKALDEKTALHERALAIANGETVKVKAVADAEHNRAMAAKDAEHAKALEAKESEAARQVAEIAQERDELKKGLSGSREAHKRTEGELATAVQTIADRNAELRSHSQAIAERDGRLAELRKEIESLEAENTSYQEQVLRAYQKIKTDEAMVARAKKAMAIALTVLDDPAATKPD